MQKDCELQDLSLEELRTISSAFDPDFYNCLTLNAVLSIHDVPGGTAPGRVRQALIEAKQRVESIFEDIHANA